MQVNASGTDFAVEVHCCVNCALATDNKVATKIPYNVVFIFVLSRI